MLYWVGQLLEPHFGPFRLFSSRLMLASIGVGVGAFLVWWFLPRVLAKLPTDRGRAFAHDAEVAVGKPTGAGVFMIPVFVFLCMLLVPWYDASATVSRFCPEHIQVLGCVLLALAFGYLDDQAKIPWGEYRKAALDLGIALLTSMAICQLEPMELWLPLMHGDEGGTLMVPPMIFVPVATLLLWISINCTNCTDGVDGLSASLLLMSFLYLGAILYVVVGHQDVAEYLRIPHIKLGANWAIMAFILMGILIGYLWHNANPSRVLMGDAGSRPFGLLLGVFSLVTGNPLLLFVVAAVVVVNGGTGLVKVALLRFFKIGIFRDVRFPLHDHCRKNLDWSNTQVLVRFVILQAVLTPIIIVFFIKLR